MQRVLFCDSKKIKIVVLILISSFLILMQSASILALSIGITPLVIDLGEVERGKDYVFEFYITSDTSKELVVDIISQPPKWDFYYPTRKRSYNFNASLASEEDVSKWLIIFDNPTIIPAKEKNFIAHNGKIIRAKKKIRVLLRIPRDAEPGYHAGVVHLSPRVNFGGMGIGVNIITVVDLFYIFKVEGRAIRKAEIKGFMSHRIGDREKVSVLVKNTGTVTLRVFANPAFIYKGNETKAVLTSPPLILKPGSEGTVSMFWDVREEEIGIYNISATIDWLTGSEHKEGVIEVQERPKTTIGFVPARKKTGFPFFVFIIPLLIIIILMIRWYRNESEY